MFPDDITLPYYAKIIDEIDNGKGCWKYLNIGIFERETDKQIGSYKRNYSNFYKTFYPFKQNNKWYALYSKDYTSTRVMSLPDCVDICGEESNAFGFCPAEYYVPAEYSLDCRNVEYYFSESFPDGSFGFIAGCVWGDDSTWKIEYLDLSKISEGILKREQKFGYIEMLRSSSLPKSIDYIEADEDSLSIALSARVSFYFKGDTKKVYGVEGIK